MNHKTSVPSLPQTDLRIDPRVALAVQAVVEFDELPARSYGVCEISRGGMFLAFKDPEVILQEYEKHGIGSGSHCEVAFSVTLPHHRQHLRVPAEVVRVTEHGIGIKFVPRDPPQLAALKRLFDRVESGH
jgi:hypothetical protein